MDSQDAKNTTAGVKQVSDNDIPSYTMQTDTFVVCPKNNNNNNLQQIRSSSQKN